MTFIAVIVVEMLILSTHFHILSFWRFFFSNLKGRSIDTLKYFEAMFWSPLSIRPIRWYAYYVNFCNQDLFFFMLIYYSHPFLKSNVDVRTEQNINFIKPQVIHMTYEYM